MTFTEAAVEILRLVGRPLHYKKITELAIERNLLSHVGKAPELTMSSRLATMVKKDRGEEPIIKVKPGVFALRDFTPQMMALADAGDDDIDLSQIPEAPAAPPPPPAVEGAEVGTAEAAPRPALPGSDVFPAEEDDDKPILAGIDDDEDEEGEGGGDRRRGRRRRRRGRGEAEAETAEGESAGSETKGEGEGEERPRQESRERDRHDRDHGRGRNDRERHDRDRDRDRDRERNRRDGRDGREGRDGRDGRDGHRDAPRLPAAELSREPGDNDLLGRDLADAVFTVLVSESRALSYAAIAGELVRRGRLVGEPATLVPTIAAAVRADAGRGAEGGRGRARFRHTHDGLALYDWFLPRDAMYRERDVVRAAERQQEAVRRSFLRKIGDLPAAGFAELVASWLNAEGVASLRGVRRPTSSPQEMHFAGTLRRGFEELRLAIVVVRGTQELTRERVVELRGSLHHYGNATLGWIVSLGGVPRATRDEATAAGATPVALFDGLALAEAMEARGVGMRRTAVPLSVIDLDTLDALRGSAEQPLREDRRDGERRDGERREGRDRDERSREGREERGRDRDREPREERPREDATRPAEATGVTADGEASDASASPQGAGQATPGHVDGQADGQTTEAGAESADKSEVRDAGEGGRRRRRRRRRRGGEREAAGGEVLAEGASEDDDELEDEAVAAAEEGAAPGEDAVVERSGLVEVEAPTEAEGLVEAVAVVVTEDVALTQDASSGDAESSAAPSEGDERDDDEE